MACRVRPARRPRWDRYLPGTGLILASLFPLLAPVGALSPLRDLGLSLHTIRVLLAVVGVALIMVAAALVDRPPVVVLALGTAGTIAGASMLSSFLVGAPLFLAGLSWILYLEGRRLFEGITFSPRGVTVHRFLKSPLRIEHDDLHHVHTSLHDDHRGTLILETEHGTVTAPHLPSCPSLQARIEARLNQEPVEATRTSLAQARERIERLLER